ncbi:alpha-D-ribose 1-methylphosphonate 5-triphosphate diphosphatase [Ilumatobacter sp.]|uniref:alpha-D-ribose 1-methylphosphonate 5-triphosphate diphosphatase n=1 Tax=Ilumatobacter sp. TaxID=1967498 RepID=UPI003751461E
MTVLTEPHTMPPSNDRRGVDVALTNVRLVLDDQIIEAGTIVIRDGVIEAVGRTATAPPDAIDGRGMLCIAGLVDTHSDGFEKELRPRPNVVLPADFALRSFESRVRAAGVTTVFHGVGFENGSKYDRSVEQAHLLCDTITTRRADADARVDHQILYRLDVRDTDGLVALETRLNQRHGDLLINEIPLVSAEDHTPGVGQYTDRSYYERYIAGTKGLDPDEAKQYIDQIVADRDDKLDNVDRALSWLANRAHGGTIRLIGHDPTSAAEIDAAVERSVSIAEFPTTVEAARRAHERGLRTVSGAPNVVRGGSHSGNVSAAELVSLGLCDGLSSDYMPTTLLGAVGTLVHDGVCDLATGVALVTSGPADTVGLADRGRLNVGQRGDIVLVDFDGRLPTVHLVIAAHDHVAPMPIGASK